MSIRLILSLLNFWLVLITAIPSAHLYEQVASDAPLPPSKDPWYTAPPGFEDALPGTVLRVRHAPGNLTRVIGNSSAAYNILYRTTNSHYSPTWAVTTLLVPQLGRNSNARQNFNQSAVLSYQVPYNSADIDASPSYNLYTTDPTTPYNAALGLGLFVLIPDFEGPLASFTAGIISGHATLDSIRAVLSLNLGLNTTAPRVALWGYSGGALASEWASELAEQYAPELSGTIVGAALGGLTPNITRALAAVNGQSFAGLIPSSILGLTSQYPRVREHLISQLRTTGLYNQTGFLAALEFTVLEARMAYTGVDVFSYFKDGSAILRDPKLMSILNREGIMGYHGVPIWPVFAYKAIGDEISAVADTDALIERYCANGANILYQRNTVGTHLQESTYSRRAAFDWLETILKGRYGEVNKTNSCTIQNVTRDGTES
ncbi:hypothetical protein FAVG1_11916 [Fusarium avenaceum]|nr:hypothetical protein FAVG1_11916 [Fusarium avenaceum]